MAISMGAAIIGSAVVGGVASYVGGKKVAKATGKAARKAQESADYATDVQKEMYEQTRADQEPWRLAGKQALKQIQQTPDFQFTADSFEQFKDPGYEFRMQEGASALEGGAAARGNVLSGAQGKALTRYGQDVASQEYGNAFNRALTTHNVELAKQQALAGVGQSATNVVSRAGMQTAGNIGNITTQSAAQQGNAAIAGAQAQANMYGNIAQSGNQAIGNYLLYQNLQNKGG